MEQTVYLARSKENIREAYTILVVFVVIVFFFFFFPDFCSHAYTLQSNGDILTRLPSFHSIYANFP